MTPINFSSAWVQLHQHQRSTSRLHMRDLFEEDAQRFAHFSLKLDGLLLDYSKNRITKRTLELLAALAEAANLGDWMLQMRQGEAINLSEQRPVLHTALRAPEGSVILSAGENIVPKVHRVLGQMAHFCQQIYSGDWRGHSGKKIKSIVNLGIGGSDLGPLMVTQALQPFALDFVDVYFVSNLDGRHLADTLDKLDPAETLFIVASKSFTTPETLLNAGAARQWFLGNGGKESHLAQHFIAVTANLAAAVNFGMAPENCFPFWDWVGGRYSIWSAIGLSVMLSIGAAQFRAFLAGAHELDQHFFQAPFLQNAPVILALIGIWYNTFYRAHTHAIMPYDQGLAAFPAYLQQLDMESNGKRVGREGEALDFDTGPIIWGEVGVNSQHAFFQLLHQGTRLIPCDFIIPARMHSDFERHAIAMLANCLAQSEALMRGKNEAEVLKELNHLSTAEVDRLLPHLVFKGNQPSNMLILDELNPKNLGKLLALYEHKIFVQGVIWGINSFDQWGVEYGKQLAKIIEPELNGSQVLSSLHDPSTRGLIEYVRHLRADK